MPAQTGWVGLCGIAAAILLFTWPRTGISPYGIGLDPSWEAMLHYAAHHRMRFGSEIAYTYGPLGFLAIPKIFYTATGLAAIGFSALVRFGFIVLCLRVLKRTFGLPVAAVIAVALHAPAIFVADVMAMMLPLLAIPIIEQGTLGRRPGLISMGLGAFTALALLVKFNVGMLAVLMLAPALLAQKSHRFRAIGLYSGGLGAFGLAGWLAAGGRLIDIAPWFRQAREFSAGYTDGGMSSDMPSRRWEIAIYALLVFGLVCGLILRRHTRQLGLLSRLTLVFVLGSFTFSFFKHGFVRHDGGHTPWTFLMVAASIAALSWRHNERFAAAAMIGAGLICAFVAAGANLSWRTSYFGPVGHLRQAWTDISDAARPSRRALYVADAKRFMRGEIGLPPAIRSLITRGRPTVQVEPEQTSIVWLEDLRWSPPPVFQNYAAHTPYLDGLNAQAVSDGRGPDLILREAVPTHVNNRSPEGDSPAYVLAVLCHYRRIAREGRWEVLQKVAARCGPEKRISTVVVRAGVPFAVPIGAEPQSVVYMKVHASRPFSERARAFFYKPVGPPLVDYHGPPRWWRTLFYRTLGSPLILRSPIPGDSGFPAEGLSVNEATLIGISGEIRIEFFSRQVDLGR